MSYIHDLQHGFIKNVNKKPTLKKCGKLNYEKKKN